MGATKTRTRKTPALPRALASTDWRERRRAVLALSEQDAGRAWPPLQAALADPVDPVRHAAVIVVGRLAIAEARDELLKARIIDSPDPDLRRAAVAALGVFGDPRDIIRLTRLLQDSDWLVRNEARKVLADAVDRLAAQEGGWATDALIHLLFLEGPTLRPLVIRALCRHGSRALPALREALAEPSPSMLAGVIEILGLLYDRHSLPAVVELARRHGDRGVRLAAARALGRLDGADAAVALVAMFDVRHPDVCLAVEESLEGIGPEAGPPLLEAVRRSRCTRVRSHAIRTLGRMRLPEALPVLREGLRSSYFQIRQATIEALSAYGPSVVESIGPLLVRSEPDVEPLLRQLERESTQEGRIRAVRVIGEMGNHRAVPALKEVRRAAADDEGLPLRRAVNRALYQLGCGAWERYCALAVVGRVDDGSRVDLLLPSLAHPSYYVRNRAVRSLARFALPQVAKALATTALEDPRYFVRRAAVQVLGGQPVEKPLRVRTALKAFTDSAAGVRVEAARVLGRLLDARAVTPLVNGLLDPVWSVREACEVALRNFPDRAARPVAKLLEDEREFVRYRVARLLGQLGDPHAVPALRRRFGREPEGGRVNCAILDSLRRLGV